MSARSVIGVCFFLVAPSLLGSRTRSGVVLGAIIIISRVRSVCFHCEVELIDLEIRNVFSSDDFYSKAHIPPEKGFTLATRRK